MAGATAGCPRVRKSPLQPKRNSGGNGNNFDDACLRNLDYRNMNGNLPSTSYNNNGNINDNSLMARPSSISGNQYGDCISDESGGHMNTFASFNLKRHESNDDEGFFKGGSNNGRGFSGRKNYKSAGNNGKNLVMENVTILKRGDKIEDFVGGVKSADEKNDITVKTLPRVAENRARGGAIVSGGHFHGRVTEGCYDDSRRALDKNAQSQAVVGGSKFASTRTVQKKKTKPPFKSSQVCPVSTSYDSIAKTNNYDSAVCVDQVDTLGDNFLVTSIDRLGPDPSTISKEVSSGILRSISTRRRSRFSEEINDACQPVILPELVTRVEGSVISGTMPASSSGPTESPVPNSLRDWWAGPAYTNSPSPRCLPLPKFFMRQKVRSNVTDTNGLGGDECKNNRTAISPEAAIRDNKKQMPLDVKKSHVGITNQVGVDAFATRNLRRLLQLE